MAERGGAHAALRAATRADHDRVDALFGALTLASAADYRAFLLAQALALPAVERALDEADFAGALADWPGRRRGDALAADLAALHTQAPDPLPPPALAGRAAQWGAAYVLEGSRLGGQLLARQLGAGQPNAYLGKVHAPGKWRDFLSALDQAIETPPAVAEAVAGARAVFALFERAGRRAMEMH
ncbi:biliverdin-producing heme oxygenase [Sphingomonas morindae]|uniref:Biliverdin-producing heme oxygenase n=1 Tax=Sphingomonas morindae TaxID=1541170 RepID=A0ABY4XAI0_9SPHN|nr:biliverdin-producing heme oxygenase [Sphingomonas morindae]USI73834.1 biliverdin-producing heme oxygenase [Sphingomonas morindae]